MKHYLALVTIFFISQVFSVNSFTPFNNKDRVNKCWNKFCEGSSNPKLRKVMIRKVIKNLLKKSEKIKNIIIYPEPDDKEDWDSGEIPWDPKEENMTTLQNKNLTSQQPQYYNNINEVTPHDLAMLFI